jgi:hypothetical protein
MKKKEYILIICLLLVVFGLTRWFYKQVEPAVPYIPGETQSESHNKVEVLPKDIEDAFNSRGINVQHVFAFDKEKLFFFRIEGRKPKSSNLPIEGITAFEDITNITIIGLRNDRCTLVTIDGKKEYDCDKIH